MIPPSRPSAGANHTQERSMEAKHRPGPDWYARRHELEPGMVFRTNDGIVKLDGRVPGDGTKWVVADWHDGWAHYGSEIEPGELQGDPIEDAPTPLAKATK